MVAATSGPTISKTYQNHTFIPNSSYEGSEIHGTMSYGSDMCSDIVDAAPVRPYHNHINTPPKPYQRHIVSYQKLLMRVTRNPRYDVLWFQHGLWYSRRRPGPAISTHIATISKPYQNHIISRRTNHSWWGQHGILGTSKSCLYMSCDIVAAAPARPYQNHIKTRSKPYYII